MWQVACADAFFGCAREPLDQQGCAGLLYVTHGEYIGAKKRAKEALNQSVTARDRKRRTGLSSSWM